MVMHQVQIIHAISRDWPPNRWIKSRSLTQLRCLQIPTNATDPVDLCIDDHIINQYLEMICDRQNGMKIHALDSHFFTLYRHYGYDISLRLIDPAVKLLSFDMVLVPIHQEDHWCLAQMQTNRILQFDGFS